MYCIFAFTAHCAYTGLRLVTGFRNALNEILIKGNHITTETGRLFLRGCTKQLPLARKDNILGYVVKRGSSVFPLRFFSVIDPWLLLLV